MSTGRRRASHYLKQVRIQNVPQGLQRVTQMTVIMKQITSTTAEFLPWGHTCARGIQRQEMYTHREIRSKSALLFPKAKGPVQPREPGKGDF